MTNDPHEKIRRVLLAIEEHPEMAASSVDVVNCGLQWMRSPETRAWLTGMSELLLRSSEKGAAEVIDDVLGTPCVRHMLGTALRLLVRIAMQDPERIKA